MLRTRGQPDSGVSNYTSLTLALAHSMGEKTITPPQRVEMQEAENLAKELTDDSPLARGVIDTFKLWPFGHTLSACFFDGDDRLKAYFVDVSKVWTTGTSLLIDFGSSPAFSACNKSKPSDIRISFKRSGAWSLVGTDSRRHDLDGPSLNVDYPQGKTWETMDKKELAYFILHELGHALALEHEHQSPEAKCGAEFDWPKVYASIPWPKKEVDFNLRTKVAAKRLRTTRYDKTSIMHYYFEPWMFKKGTESKCYVGHNLEPSSVDLQLVRESYPALVALQDSHLQQRADASSAQLASLKLAAPKLSKVGIELKSVLARFERPLSLEFDLTGGNPTRGRGPEQQILKDCLGLPSQVSEKGSCQIAADALQLVISVQPK
jgi:Astacin (Peptidase family M12A)